MKIIDKVLEETLESEKELIECYCPSEFDFNDLEDCPHDNCMNCEKCWNREVKE